MRYKPEFADDARDFCRRGATDEELADYFAVCVRTIYRWRNMHEEFAEAVVVGKDHADARVERALYSRAVGCTVKRTRVFKHAGEDPVYASYLHHLPPDPVAALQWLRVRQPKKWGAQQPEDQDGFSAARMVEKALARAEEHKRATPMPPREPPSKEVAPDAGLESEPRSCPDEGTAPDTDSAPTPVAPIPKSKPKPKSPQPPAADSKPAPPFPVLDFSPRGYG
ncbi:MAG: hypothetical protein WC729_06530 [Sphingomonas sp.]|jgi:hypothetical protein|uniref:hypothetical protein n=1 Tax=Sphingomonas sp. TaxID=28214 RepID=UPI003566CF6A